MNVSAPEFKPSGSFAPVTSAPPLRSVEPAFRSMMKENSSDIGGVAKKSSSVMKPGTENVQKGNFTPPTTALKQLSVAAKEEKRTTQPRKAAKKDDRQRKGRGAERRKRPGRRDEDGKGNTKGKQNEPKRKSKGADRKKGPPEERAKVKPSQQRQKAGNKASSRSREEKRPSRISKGKGAIKKNTESFEPMTQNIYVRRVLAGEFVSERLHDC